MTNTATGCYACEWNLRTHQHTCAKCNACGRPTGNAGEFCTRPDCLTFGSGALVAGPGVRA